MNPSYFRDALRAAAVAPDRRLYYAACSERVPLGGVHETCVPKIQRVAITIAADGSVSHGPEEVVYRAPAPAPIRFPEPPS